MSSLPPHSKPQEAGELKNENERKETNERARGEQRTTAEGVEERSHDIHNYTEEGEFKRSKTDAIVSRSPPKIQLKGNPTAFDAESNTTSREQRTEDENQRTEHRN